MKCKECGYEIKKGRIAYLNKKRLCGKCFRRIKQWRKNLGNTNLFFNEKVDSR